MTTSRARPLATVNVPRLVSFGLRFSLRGVNVASGWATEIVPWLSRSPEMKRWPAVPPARKVIVPAPVLVRVSVVPVVPSSVRTSAPPLVSLMVPALVESARARRTAPLTSSVAWDWIEY